MKSKCGSDYAFTPTSEFSNKTLLLPSKRRFHHRHHMHTKATSIAIAQATEIPITVCKIRTKDDTAKAITPMPCHPMLQSQCVALSILDGLYTMAAIDSITSTRFCIARGDRTTIAACASSRPPHTDTLHALQPPSIGIPSARNIYGLRHGR